MVMSCLAHFPRLKYGKMCLDNRLAAELDNLAANEAEGVLVGVDDPNYIKTTVVENRLKKVSANRYIPAHLPYTKKMDSLLAKHGYKGIVVTRDPRDVAVSHVPFILKTEHHYLHQHYHGLNNNSARLMSSIRGFSDEQRMLRLEPISTRVTTMLRWRESPRFLAIRFEDLIGPHGGGKTDVQYEVIKMILDHLNLQPPKQGIEGVAREMIGGSYTFRKGVIGGWRDSFMQEHKDAFKEIAGDLLIELGYEKDFDW